VAFVGPFGVGKTTAVRVVSDTPVVNTDVLTAVGRLPRPGSPRKRTTTVGLDYGEWFAPDDSVVSVVGTPGQERFITVRRSAEPRSTSIVLWVFGDRPYAVDEAAEWLGYLGDQRTWSRLVVAVTRIDETTPGPRLESFRPMLDGFADGIPLLSADPRERDDVVRVLNVALRVPALVRESA
jgi:signal recognition particle receptor subunit beta